MQSFEYSKQPVIMMFGTFDIIHEGHLHLIKQARALSENPFLIISIARDVNVVRIKGLPPRNSEQSRLSQMEKVGLVDQVILGSTEDYFSHIRKIKPEYIALGYDQVAYVTELEQDLKKANLPTKVIRLKPHEPLRYKTSLLDPRQ